MTPGLRFFTLVCVLFLPILIHAQRVTPAAIEQALGRPGQKTGDVYRVSFSRTDLHVSVNGLVVKPGLRWPRGRLSSETTTMPWSWVIWSCSRRS
jgi:hypothetical protein